MILEKISLNNFRNYSQQTVGFGKSFNYIYGNNGEGKTNILEAISLITFGKSLVGSPEFDCVKFGEKAFYTEGIFKSRLDTKFSVSLDYNTDTKRKSYSLNKEKVSGFSSEIFGRFPVVFLTPHSLAITYGNPSERRRFFDIMISQTSKLYLEYLKDLNRLIKQKNALLKDFKENGKTAKNDFINILDSYNEKLIEISSEIIFRRFEFLADFKNFFEEKFNYLTSGYDFPVIDYLLSSVREIDWKDFSTYTYDDILGIMSAKFKEITDDEISRGICLIGPQRDDFVFKIIKNKSVSDNKLQGFYLKNFASQGEHKTFLIALKLAEFDITREKTSENPVMLLDDVLSELDSERVTKIISYLKDFGQIFLTSTEIGYVENIKNFYDNADVKIFKVENNSINQK